MTDYDRTSYYTTIVELVGVGIIAVIVALGVLNTFLSTRVSQRNDQMKTFQQKMKILRVHNVIVGVMNDDPSGRN